MADLAVRCQESSVAEEDSWVALAGLGIPSSAGGSMGVIGSVCATGMLNAENACWNPDAGVVCEQHHMHWDREMQE